MTTHKIDDEVALAFGPGTVLGVRAKNASIGVEYLIGREPDIVAIRNDGTPVRAHGYPQWVAGYLVRKMS